MGRGQYGDYGRMQRLMDQMHRTNDMDSHYQLMQQHWQEMDRMMEQLRNNPAQQATPEQLRQRDRTIEQLQEQMRQYHREFDRMPYGHRGGMR